MKAQDKVNLGWRYALLVAVLVVGGPVTHFINQYQRGYPLDINYFWSELSPQALFGRGLYNGFGGSDWQIGRSSLTPLKASQPASVEELREFALQLVNRDRKLNARLPLVADPLLSLAAQRHAEDMLARQYFDHVSPEGTTPSDRFLAVGGSDRVGVGENIMYSRERGLGLTYGKVEEVQRGWMYSNGHRANILTEDYTKFGYGIAIGPGGKIYAVQMFATAEPAL
jgi:uncharacterized protein YkwD